MILYLSGTTDYDIYDELLTKNLIAGGYQAQRFNYNFITGLAHYTEVISIASLPYKNVCGDRIERNGNVKYISVKNKPGKFHKFYAVQQLLKEGKQIIKQKKPQFILCDAISLSHSIAALKLSKKYKIPAVAIVTDLPEVMCNGCKMSIFSKYTAKLMKRYPLYVLLTEQMNEIVNPKKTKPYVVVEGSYNVEESTVSEKSSKFICFYSGSLWKKDAGIEYLIEGFKKANLSDSELHFYGTGEMVEEIKRISKIHTNIQYKGFLTNKEIMRKQREASLLINPRPSNEAFCKYSFPSKTFEYMASGTPVLMTRLPGIPHEYFNYVYTIDEETEDGMAHVLAEIFLQKDEEKRRKGASAKEFIATEKNHLSQTKKIWDFLSQY